MIVILIMRTVIYTPRACSVHPVIYTDYCRYTTVMACTYLPQASMMV